MFGRVLSRVLMLVLVQAKAIADLLTARHADSLKFGETGEHEY